MDPKINRILRYTGVNLISTTIDYAVFLPLAHAFGYPVPAAILAYLVALTVNCFLTKSFVFEPMSHKSEMRLVAEFFGTGLFGLVLTAVVTGITITDLHFSPVVGKTIAVLVCFVVLYFVRSRFVFSVPPSGAASR